MRDKEFEATVIAKVIQDGEVIEKLRVAKIKPRHFESEILTTLYKKLLWLDEIDNITPSGLKQLIANDDKIADDKKVVYIKKIDQLAQKDCVDFNLSLNLLQGVKQESDFLDTLRQSAQKFKSGNFENLSDLIEEHYHQVEDSLGRDFDFEVFDYFDGWEERQARRLEIASGSANGMKMGLNLEGFEKYFKNTLLGGMTVAISGPTYAGKSLLVQNFVMLAIHPFNGLDTLLVVSENRPEEAYTRMDSMVLDVPFDMFYDQDYIMESMDKSQFFDKALQEGWGKLRIVKVHPNEFSANTLKTVIEQARDSGMDPKVLALDSPDHQVPISPSSNPWINKGKVYYDNKALFEKEDILGIVTTPMKASSTKKDKPDNEDVANSYDIPRVLDKNIMINKSNDADAIINRMRVVVTKNRGDSFVDYKEVTFRIKDSLILEPFNESLQEQLEKSGVKYKLKTYDEHQESFDESGNYKGK